MAGNSDGKKWEGVFRGFIESQSDVSIDRLPDPMMGYKGVRNICDFIVYKRPLELYVECKATRGNTLPFGNITENQWEGLREKSKITGVIGVILIWFTEHDTVAVVDIRTAQKLRDAGKKSIHIDMVNEYKGILECPCKVPRSNPKLDVDSFWVNITHLSNLEEDDV